MLAEVRHQRRRLPRGSYGCRIGVQEPQFEEQTKTKLGNDDVAAAVDQAFGLALGDYLEENPKDAKAIVKVILAATARHAARHARELVQRKPKVAGRQGFPENSPTVRAATVRSPRSSSSRVTSAGGTAKSGRDRNFQLSCRCAVRS